MPFLGRFWVTSWVGCFLASSQGLLKVPDYLTSAFPARVFSVVNSPIEIPTPGIFSTQFSSGDWSSNSSVATVPNLAFQTGADSFQFQPQKAVTTVRPSLDIDTQQNKFCRPPSEGAKNSPIVATPLPSSSAAWQETSPDDASKATLPQQLLHVIQNLFSWRQRPDSLNKKLASSVEIISTHSGDQVGDKQQNSQVKRAKRGLWRYTQMLASKAVAAVPPTEKEQFQVRVKGHLIAQLPQQQQAELMAQRLKQFFLNSTDSYLNASPVEPELVNGLPAVKIGDRIIFKVDDTLATALDRNGELLAIEWANNLRTALGKVPLQLAEAQKQMHNLVETSRTFEGMASWYGPQFHGGITATGEIYNQHELTAAHPSLPFNTYLKVKNLDNGDSVIVRINDRGPFLADENRNLDLSREAARCINSEEAGVIPFEAIIMQPPLAESEKYWLKK